MRVVDERAEQLVSFTSIKKGSVFDLNGGYFLKTGSNEAVALLTGERGLFSTVAVVVPVNAKLVIED